MEAAHWTSPSHSAASANGQRPGRGVGARGRLEQRLRGRPRGPAFDGVSCVQGLPEDVGGAGSCSWSHVSAGSRRQRLLLGRCFSAGRGAASGSGKEPGEGAEPRRSRRPEGRRRWRLEGPLRRPAARGRWFPGAAALLQPEEQLGGRGDR